ncbi:MAG: gluconate 2-dehydrogenase subunit 3 family protein [Litorimonas sp.]
MQKLINRRIFIGGSIATIGVLSISGCQNAETNILLVDQDGQFFTADELTILSDVAEIMIPRTGTPGAIDAEVPAAVDGMMMSWASPSTQDQFRSILEHFNELAQQSYKSDYVKLRPDDRSALVENLDSRSFSKSPTEAAGQYKRLKDIIFLIYYSSEKGIRNFVPVPGFYSGNLTLEEYEMHMSEMSYD